MSDYKGDRIEVADNLVVSRRELEVLARGFSIQRIYLFGSAARDTLRPDSDIDILVDFEPGKSPSLAELLRMTLEFSKLFKGRRVDVATRAILNNPFRRRQIEKDMEELYAA